MTYPEPHQEPYTKYPNIYTDTVKPKLTSTQRDVCDVVIRQTMGWHRTSARISISTFMYRTGKSRRAIIRAKQQLVAMGLLVLLEDGGGSITSEYAIELYYNKHDRQQGHSDELVVDTTTTDISNVDNDVPIMEPVPLSITTPTPTSTKSDSTMPSKSTTTVAHDLPGGAFNAPLPSKDLSIINIKKRQTEGATSNVTSTTNKSRTSNLRCMFSKLFSESAEEGDWGYFGYLTRTYGVEACASKLNYMSEHRKSHPIINPKGFLRRALECDYQPPAFIVAKIKADEAARVAGEHSRRAAQEWEGRIQEFDYEAAAASLQSLLDTLA